MFGRWDVIIFGIFFVFISWVGNMIILVMFIVGGNFVWIGVMILGDLMFFMMYIVFVGFSLFGVSGFYLELMKGVGVVSCFFEF